MSIPFRLEKNRSLTNYRGLGQMDRIDSLADKPISFYLGFANPNNYVTTKHCNHIKLIPWNLMLTVCCLITRYRLSMFGNDSLLQYRLYRFPTTFISDFFPDKTHNSNTFSCNQRRPSVLIALFNSSTKFPCFPLSYSVYH